MIRIDKITRGRFGNKILQYNSLVQIANNLGVEPSCVKWDGHHFFKNLVEYKPNNNPIKKLNWNDVLNKTDEELRKMTDTNCLNIDDPSYLLHNVFFRVTKKDPRNFLELKDKFKPNFDTKHIHIGIHIRGGDILGADGNNGREIHPINYYINSINFLENSIREDKIYHICTDDNNYLVFHQIIQHLSCMKIQYRIGTNTISNRSIQHSNHNYIYDFGILTECDILICSSSTFVIAASFLGKSNKKLIFYKKWINKNIEHEEWGNISESYPLEYWHSYDNFWIDLATKNSKYLNIFKLIN